MPPEFLARPVSRPTRAPFPARRARASASGCHQAGWVAPKGWSGSGRAPGALEAKSALVGHGGRRQPRRRPLPRRGAVTAGSGPGTLTAARTGGAPVTEEEWLACDDPVPMLKLMRRKASPRKLRLFACADM